MGNENKPQTWWRTNTWTMLEPVVVLRATSKTITILEKYPDRQVPRLYYRASMYQKYFPTFEEAKAFEIKRARASLISRQAEVMRLQMRVAGLEGATEESIRRQIAADEEVFKNQRGV